MKKSLFTLSMVALATNQAIAAIPTSYKLVPVDAQPAASYQLTVSGLTEDGTITGTVTSRIQAKDAAESAYTDTLGAFDDETVTDLVQDVALNSSLSNALKYLAVTSSTGFIANPSVSLVSGLDSTEEQLTTNSRLFGGIDGQFYGTSSGPWSPVSYTDSDGNEVDIYQRNFDTRSFLTDNNGSTYPLMPLYTLPDVSRGSTQVLSASDKRGGLSVVSSASSSYLVGTSSSTLSSSAQSSLDTCSEDDKVEPILACLAGITYQTRATAWPIENGVPGAPISLGVLSEKTGDDINPASYSSVANDVNDAGIVAGQSSFQDGDVIRNVATLFDINTGAPIKAITKTNSDINNSTANAINNNGLVVGRTAYPAAYSTYKFFVYNNNSDTISYPSTFYGSANSVAYDINNSDLVVGAADYERLPPSSARRQHAFVYDADNGVFADINTRLQFDSSTLTQVYNGDTCAAREDWVLEGAQKINDAGQIAATAVTTLRDSSGNQVLDDDGNVQYVLRPVLLEPSDEAATSCTEEEGENYSRSGGGSFGIFGLGVLGLLGLRRRKH